MAVSCHVSARNSVEEQLVLLDAGQSLQPCNIFFKSSGTVMTRSPHQAFFLNIGSGYQTQILKLAKQTLLTKSPLKLKFQ